MIDVHFTLDAVALQLLLASAAQLVTALAMLVRGRQAKRRPAPAKKRTSAPKS